MSRFNIKYNQYWFSFKRLPELFAFAYLLLLISSPLSNLIGDLKGKMAILICVFLSEFILKGFSRIKNVFHQRGKELFFLILWLFVLVIYKIFEIGDMITWGNYFMPFMYFFSAIIIGSIYFNNIHNYKFFIMIATLVLCITSIMIVKYLYDTPYLVRLVKDRPYDLSSDKLNVIGAISYFSGIVLATPFMLALLSYYKKGSINPSLLLLLYMPFFASLVLSTMLAPIIFVVLAFMGMLYLSNKDKLTSLIIIMSTGILIIFIPFLYFNMEQTIFINEKVQTFFFYVIEGDTENFSRVTQAVTSIQSFLKNPLFGIGLQERTLYIDVGEHSTFIDAFTEFGMIGFFPYIFFLYFAWKRIYSEYRKNTNIIWNHARIVGFLLYIIAGISNPWGFDNLSAVFFGALVLGPLTISGTDKKTNTHL